MVGSDVISRLLHHGKIRIVQFLKRDADFKGARRSHRCRSTWFTPGNVSQNDQHCYAAKQRRSGQNFGPRRIPQFRSVCLEHLFTKVDRPPEIVAKKQTSPQATPNFGPGSSLELQPSISFRSAGS